MKLRVRVTVRLFVRHLKCNCLIFFKKKNNNNKNLKIKKVLQKKLSTEHWASICKHTVFSSFSRLPLQREVHRCTLGAVSVKKKMVAIDCVHIRPTHVRHQPRMKAQLGGKKCGGANYIMGEGAETAIFFCLLFFLLLCRQSPAMCRICTQCRLKTIYFYVYLGTIPGKPRETREQHVFP